MAKTSGAPVVYPPYGHIYSPHAGLAKRMAMPNDWTAPSGADSGHWETWVGKMTEDLADTVWPQWSDRAWKGKAVALMDRLTRAELDLMDVVGTQFGSRIVSKAPNDKRHSDLFFAEDEGIRLETLAAYSPKLAERVPDFQAIWDSGNARKCGALHLVLKDRLQRPRAHQAALILGLEFGFFLAKSSMTPSAISGHSIQGIIGTATVFDCLLAGGVSKAEQEALEQIAVDIGDRRVLAGVHYPGDNVSSWITALRMIPHVFARSAVVHKFVARAITKRSLVHAALRDSRDTAYAPMLKLLDRELEQG